MNFKHNIFALIFSLSSALNFDGKIVQIPYQFDPRIHNFGNIGIGGIFHSFMARPFTKLIDQVAYDGENIRENIIRSLKIENPKFITDFCCGTGTSTEALQKVFSDAEVTGVDTSKEMLRVAKLFTENINFLQENVESVELDEKQDLITLLFGFHEIPQEARVLILENIKNNLKDDGKALIVDIDTSYKPSKAMLSGEPYVECYLKNIDLDILQVFPEVETEVYIENHVRIWKA